MSSYLNIYLLPKAENSKHLFLAEFSSSSPIYQLFNENVKVPCKENKLKLTTPLLRNIYDNLKDSLDTSEKRCSEYEKHCINSEIIDEIISIKEYIQELYSQIAYINLLQEFVYSSEECTYCKFEGVYINID